MMNPEPLSLRFALVFVLLGSLLVPASFAQNVKRTERTAAVTTDPNAVDYDALTRIRWEAFHRSQVMDSMAELTDRIGPRLTNSPNEKRAAAWARERLTKWGVENVHSEPWGAFGPGWTYEVSHLRMLEPDVAELIALPKAWSRGTDGVLRGKVVRTNMASNDDFAKYRGKLAGAIVLNGEVRKLPLAAEAKSERYTEQSLTTFAEFPVPSDPKVVDPRTEEYVKRTRFLRELAGFLEQEKAAALLEGSRAPFDGGTFNVQGNGRAYRQGEPLGPPMLSLAVEHFNRLARLADRGVPVEIEMDVKTTFHNNNGDLSGYNVIAEIPGSDLKDQVVMVGAHLDSWHGATGATDNAAGTAVVMEAMRILKATGLKPRRTIRLALWTGEEQGLLGSAGYVREHLGIRTVREDGEYAYMPADSRPLVSLQLKPEHAKISAYFNVDSGTGKIRGVALQENQALEPIFREWMAPVKDLGMTTASMRSSTGSDFLSFDHVGVPGIDFEQDPIEYSTRSHHTNMDTLDRIQPEDLLQASAVVASFVYHAAMRDQLLPRKPLPQPEPEPTKPKTGVVTEPHK
jgi:hypothetical protein